MEEHVLRVRAVPGLQVHREDPAHGRDSDPRGSGPRAGRELTEARIATASEDAVWDDLVQQTGRAHVLQTKGWAEAKALTGWRAERYVFDDGGVCQVLLRPLRFGLVFAYAPRGPLAMAPLADAIAALRRALGQHRCVAFLCDPEVPDSPDLIRAVRRAGGRPSPVFVQPRRTLIINASVDPELLLAGMRKKTRQYIRKAERGGVVTEETADLERFHRVLRTVGERDRFAVHSLDFLESLRSGLGDRLHVLMARVGTEDVGALMLARMEERAWELYGGWSGTHAEERPFYLLKWRAIQRMRQLGVERYDMWGLSDPARSGEALPRGPVLDLVASRLGLRSGGTTDPLAGVTEFKLGFGGDVVSWIGAIEVPVRRLLFPIWQLFGRRRLARAAR